MKEFKIGDKIYDSRICRFGEITEVIEVPPEVSLECWYGGILYRHSGMSHLDTNRHAVSLHLESELGEPVLPYNTLTQNGVTHPAQSAFA